MHSTVKKKIYIFCQARIYWLIIKLSRRKKKHKKISDFFVFQYFYGNFDSHGSNKQSTESSTKNI